MTPEQIETEFYCGCEHHRPGSEASARWDEDGCCTVCGVDVDPWTRRAFAAEAEVAALRAGIRALAGEWEKATSVSGNNPRTYLTGRADATRICAERLRALLASAGAKP